MRRTLTLLISASLVAAACGGGSDDTGATDVSSADTVERESDTADAADASNSDDTAADEPPVTFEDVGPPPTNPDKPTDIAFPGSAPDQLEITVLAAGDGPVAEEGDTVIVDYVGVRSVDGLEFDNSYDRFTPFSVGPLGSAPVIQGWNDGLLGSQAGAQLQLDIPSDQAYGEAARSDVIRENEPLTFVIDVRSVIKPPDPADAPTEAGVEPSEGATEVLTVDLIEGDGAVLEEGMTAVFSIVMFRGDNGVQLDSTWESEPIQIPMSEGGFPALVEGMPGMSVGGRRAITVGPDKAFGPDGNPQLGLPAGTDITLVVDLFGAY